jgi:hypothetical protein
MGDDDHTPTNSGYHGGADERQPQPNLQLPQDYWGVEGTWDSDGNWHGGTVHNPIHDVPIPGSLDPSQVLPHGSHAPGTTLSPLSHTQVENLHHSKTLLSEAIMNLQSAQTADEIIYNLPSVLTVANAAVYGQSDWEHNLAASCRTWVATEPANGTDDQFHRARDELVAAGWTIFNDIEQWLHQNDQIMYSSQGNMALQQLAQVADAAHHQLQPH